MSNDIVQINVSRTQSGLPSALQQSGILISQGGTTLATYSTAIITAQSDLTAILASPSAAVTELQAMYNTFSLNNTSGVSITVVELGTAGTHATNTILFTANPSYGVQASGTITLTGNPSPGNTVDINGTTVTFVSTTPVGNQVLIGSTSSDTIAALQLFLQNSSDVNLAGCTYGTIGLVTTVTSRVFGTAGNAYVLTAVGANITVSGTGTLAGGVAADTLTIQGTAITFVNASPTGNQVLVGATSSETIANLLAFLQASIDANLYLMTYALSGLTITATAKITGAGGNSYTLAKSSSAITIGGATFSGGGTNTAAGGIQELNTFLLANPGMYYAALAPGAWADETTFPTFLNNYTANTSKFYVFFNVVTGASFTGAISSTTLTVTNLTGHLSIGSYITGSSVTANTQITEIGVVPGTYVVNNSQTVIAETMTAANNYSSYYGVKSAVMTVKAPTDAITTFPAAAFFAKVIGTAPSDTNKVAPFAFREVFGTIAYGWNPSEFTAFKSANVNYIATGAEGGLPNLNMLKWGVVADGRDFLYWYAVDWIQINLKQSLANEIINGNNNSINPLYYNQLGINRLQNRAQQTANQGVRYGMFLSTSTTPIVQAISFITYTANNPNDYPLGIYNGLSLTATPSAGFKNITFALGITDLVTG